MEENFNRQFIMIDFDTLESVAFQELVGGVFAAYGLLRKRIWRSQKENRYGLHEQYAAGDLCAAMSQEEIARKLHTTERNARRFIKALKDRGLVKAVNTGRGNIYKLGEVVQAHTKEGEMVRKEIYYLDILAQQSEQHLSRERGQKPSAESGQEAPSPSGQDRSGHRIDKDIDKSVHASQETKEEGEVAYLTAQILSLCGDARSRPFYEKVSRCLTSDAIFHFLSEIRQDPQVRNRGAVFTAKVKAYLREHPNDPRLRALIGAGTQFPK